MNVLKTMGARLIRSQTMGVSVGNPLSLMPTLGHYNHEGWLSCSLIYLNTADR